MQRILIAACALFFALFFVFSARAQDSSAEARNIFSDAANLQNAGKYSLAIDQWQKFLANHGADPLAEKANYYLGVCLLQEKKYAQAADAFSTVVGKFPKFATREEAYLNLGWSQFRVAQTSKENPKPLYETSAKTFAAMLKEFPPGKGERADQALWYMAESLYLMGDAKASIAPYTSLVKNHKESSLRADALYALGVTHEELGQYEQAGPVYDTYLTEFAEAPLATEVAMRKGETIFQAALKAEGDAATKQLTSARDRFATAAAVEGFALRSHATMRQALCEAKLSNFAKAAELYAGVATNFAKSADAAEATIAAARAYYRADDFNNSFKWFDKAYKAGGKHVAEAAHWLCRIDLKNNRPQPAIDRAAKEIAGAAESAYFVNLKMDEADGLDRVPEKREEALAKYVAIATDHSGSSLAPQALYNAAFTAMDIKKFDEGVKHASTFAEQYADDSLAGDAAYVLAECQLLSGKHAEAETTYADMLAKFSNRPDAELWRVRHGLAIYLQKKYQEVVDALSPHVAGMKNPASVAETQFLIGSSQFELKKYDDAISALNASNKADAKWRQADETLLVLSRAYQAKDNLKQARAMVEKMIAGFGQSSLMDQALYRLGEYAYATGDYEVAATNYEKSATDYPNSAFAPYAKFGNGWAHFQQKKYEPAAAAFSSVITDHPKHELAARSQLARGLIHRQTKDFQAAVTDLDAYLATNPQGAEKANAYYEKAVALVGLKKSAEAIPVLDKLVAEFPKYSAIDKVYYELGWAHHDTGDMAKSVASFASITKQTPDSPLAGEAFYHVGEKAYADEKYAEAVPSYEQALAKSGKGPLNEKAIYKLGWSNYKLEKFDKSLEYFAKQTAEYPKGALYSDAVFMQAESLFKLKKFEEAMPVFETALTEVVANPKANDQLKVITLLHGGQTAAQLPTQDWNKSLEYLTQIPEKYPNSELVNEANFEIGMAQHGLGQKKEALASFEKATKDRQVVGARARFMRGEIYFVDKDYANAEKEFLLCMFGFGGDKAIDAVKPWQAKCGYEAGRVHDVQIAGSQGAEKAKHIKSAIEHYQYVVEKHPKESYAAEATKRVAELKML